MSNSVTDVNEAFSVIGSFGWAQIKTALPIIAGGNIYISWLMCIGIFTQYKNKSPTDPVQIHSVYEEFDCTDFQANVMTSLCMLGVLLGNLIFGKVADSHGRRGTALLVLPASILIASASAILTYNWLTYAAFRFSMGFCIGGMTVSIAVIGFELVGSDVWGYLGIAMAAFFGMGVFFLANIARFFLEWRTLTLVLVIPNCYLFWIIHRSPESPRWLYSIGKVDEAEKILKDFGEQNGKTRQELDRIRLSRARTGSGAVAADTVVDIFKSKPVVVRLLVLLIAWFSNSLTYYGLTLGAGDLGDNVYENTMFSGLSEMPGYFLCILTMENAFLGRRRTSILFLIICGAAAMAMGSMLKTVNTRIDEVSKRDQIGN